MATNLYDQPRPLEFKFSRTPLEPLAAALQMKQKRFDTYRAAADELSQQQLPSLQADRPRANAILQDVESRIDSMVEEAGGDYSNLGSSLYSLKRNMHRNFSPGGEAHAIMSNKQAFDQSVKSERERLDKGEITDEQFSLWYRNTLDTYEGIGEFNPTSGSYNILAPEALAKYVDPYELGIDIAKELEPFVDEVKFDQVSGQWIVTQGQKTSILRPEDIQSIVNNRLQMSDPYMSYVQQLYELRGFADDKLDKAVQTEINATAKTLGATFARYDVSKEQGLKANPFALANYRHGLNQQLMAPFLQEIRQRYSPITTTGRHKKLSMIDISPAPTKVDSSLIRPGSIGLISDTSAGRSFSQVATNPKIAQSIGMDQGLAQVIMKNNPNASDRQLLELYNKSLDNTHALPSYEVSIDNPQIQKQLTEGLVDKSNLYNFPIRVKKKDGTWTEPMGADEALDELGVSYEDLFDDKGNLKSAISGMQGLTEGIGPAFTVEVAGKGQIGITGWNRAAEQIGDMFTYITNPLRTGERSAPISSPVINGGQPIYTNVDYQRLSDGTVSKDLKIFDATTDADISNNVNLPALSAQYEQIILNDMLPKVKASQSTQFLPYIQQYMQ